MSDDIVQRLRELFYPDQIEWEAADEIERLRHELGELVAALTAWREARRER